MKVVYIDMDDTICDFITRYNQKLKENPEIKYPQSQYGFFLDLDPISGAIEAVNYLREKYDVYILTRPSYRNPLCYTEKRVWIEKYFGIDFCEKLIICPNKGLLIGDYLIDDFIWENFRGKQIQYGVSPYENWEKVLKNF